ncbi:MAG: hypothetical protein K8W52_16780 [Deltaproteobacteria bacterium]|nr:hypothetical protein [Deltaproteobacteria bacterium]
MDPFSVIPAGVSAVQWMSNVAATGIPWASQAATTVASQAPTFMQPAANWALPFLNPATAGAAEAGATAATAGAAEVGAGATAATAAGAEVGAGGAGAAGAGVAAPAAAVVGAGLAGLAAGTGMAVVADDYGKGGMFGKNEYGQERSGFDWASDQGHSVSDWLGGGTAGDVAGAVTTGALSIPAGLAGFGQAIGTGVGNAGMAAVDALGHWFE